MAYNSYYPATYTGIQQPYNNFQNMPLNNSYTAPQMNYQTPVQNTTNGIIWVQGEAAAKAYPVAPGASVLLMDSEGECFYIKSTDNTGMPQPLRTFEYHEVVSTPTIPQASNDFDPNVYVKREEYEELKRELEELKSNNTSMKSNKMTTNRSVNNG